mmetsp:Transcript_117472/g.228382  ORF Transcript_117472/g.228382 Transcript_117472/m.228382 type:complete len:85 (+) Transcript_117472:286-540(+)
MPPKVVLDDPTNVALVSLQDLGSATQLLKSKLLRPDIKREPVLVEKAGRLLMSTGSRLKVESTFCGGGSGGFTKRLFLSDGGTI